jgi:hypothetical protein
MAEDVMSELIFLVQEDPDAAILRGRSANRYSQKPTI